VNWSDLHVIAAQGARPDAGAVIGRPVARDRSGSLFIIRNIDDEFPAPNLRLPDEEFQAGVASGYWIQLPDWPAQRHCLTLAMSRPFERALLDAPGSQQLPHLSWFQSRELHITYAHRDVLARWRSQVADILLAHAEWRIGTAVATGMPVEEGLRSDLRQVIFVTDERRDKQRMRVYLDLALLDRHQRETVSVSTYQLLQRDFGLRDWEVDEKLELHARKVFDYIHRDELLPLTAFMPDAESVFCTIP
jgi:hypothetical protein